MRAALQIKALMTAVIIVLGEIISIQLLLKGVSHDVAVDARCLNEMFNSVDVSFFAKAFGGGIGRPHTPHRCASVRIYPHQLILGVGYVIALDVK